MKVINAKLTTGQVEGALPNGTRVVKMLKAHPSETVPVGSYATITGSMELNDKTLVYCVLYDGLDVPVHHVDLPGRFRVVDTNA